jgi:hypothetical protein
LIRLLVTLQAHRSDTNCTGDCRLGDRAALAIAAEWTNLSDQQGCNLCFHSVPALVFVTCAPGIALVKMMPGAKGRPAAHLCRLVAEADRNPVGPRTTGVGDNVVGHRRYDQPIVLVGQIPDETAYAPFVVRVTEAKA